jgi:hypothetical protein
MSNYIPNHQKTQRVFTKRETELRHAIRHEFSRERIVRAAEKLREARLKIFKSEFSRCSVLQATSWKPCEEAQRWQAMPVDEIIEQYRENAAVEGDSSVCLP